MAYVSKIEYDGAFYDIQDAVAQEKADTATSAAESAVATAEAAEAAAETASETAEEAKAIAQGVAGSYSFDELDTGATWVDGRHIFKKTYHVPSVAISANSWATLISNIAVENFDMILHSEIIMYQTGASKFSIEMAFDVRIIQTALSIYSFADFTTPRPYYITIYYVKTA